MSGVIYADKVFLRYASFAFLPFYTKEKKSKVEYSGKAQIESRY